MKLFNLIQNNNLREVLRNGPDNYYLTYKIPKKTKGYREINAPQDPLKAIQEELLHLIYYRIIPSKAAHGFVPYKKMKDGAEEHLGSKVILNIDLKDFFNSFTYDKIFRINTFVYHSLKMNKVNIDKDDVKELSRLVSFKKRLPQGSPCSPFITNIGFKGIDKKLEEYSKNNNLTYTRYADDLSFSSWDYSVDMLPHYEEITQIIHKAQFKVNERKTRILRPHNRMTVTGINVNDKLGVPKWKARNFRAKIHNLKKSGRLIDRLTYEKLRGYAEWIKSLNPPKGEKLIEEIGLLNLDF